MTYSSTYKGAGRNGHIHTTSSARVVSIGTSGMAQMPAVSMSSTSSIRQSVGNSGVASVAMPQVQGIRTSASNISGGVTTVDTHGHVCPNIRRGPGDPDGKGHNWVNNGDGTYTCTICGLTISEDDYLDGNFPPCNPTPIEDGPKVWLFMAALAAAYTLYKKRDSHPTETSVMRT